MFFSPLPFLILTFKKNITFKQVFQSKPWVCNWNWFWNGDWKSKHCFKLSLLFSEGVFLLLPSLQSSKAHSDNKFRQRKMSSLCIVGIVWFGVPEGISKYVSTVINQHDTRTEMTLCFSFGSTQSRVSIRENTVVLASVFFLPIAFVYVICEMLTHFMIYIL